MANSIVIIKYVFRYDVMRTDMKIYGKVSCGKSSLGNGGGGCGIMHGFSPHTQFPECAQVHTHTHTHTGAHTHAHAHTKKNIMAAPRFPVSPSDPRPTALHYAAAVRFALLNRHPRSESIYPLRATCTRSDTKHTHRATHTHTLSLSTGNYTIYFCTYTLYINERTLQYILTVARGGGEEIK